MRRGSRCRAAGEPGSPVEPKLFKKFLTTTWVSAIVFAVVWMVFTFHLVRLPELRG